jgi:hypothetical protein
MRLIRVSELNAYEKELLEQIKTDDFDISVFNKAKNISSNIVSKYIKTFPHLVDVLFLKNIKLKKSDIQYALLKYPNRIFDMIDGGFVPDQSLIKFLIDIVASKKTKTDPYHFVSDLVKKLIK